MCKTSYIHRLKIRYGPFASSVSFFTFVAITGIGFHSRLYCKYLLFACFCCCRICQLSPFHFMSQGVGNRHLNLPQNLITEADRVASNSYSVSAIDLVGEAEEKGV